MSSTKVRTLSIVKNKGGKYTAKGVFAESNVVPHDWVKCEWDVEFDTKRELELYILNEYSIGMLKGGSNKYRLIDDLIYLKKMVPGGWDADDETRKKGIIKGLDLYDELSKDNGKYYLYSKHKKCSIMTCSDNGASFRRGFGGKLFSRAKAEIKKLIFNSNEDWVNEYGTFKLVGEREKEIETQKLEKSKSKGFGIGD